MERYTNELLDSWVGKRVFASCLAYPELDEAFFDKLRRGPRNIRQQPLHSMFGVYALEDYDQVGITLSILYGEGGPSKPVYVPGAR